MLNFNVLAVLSTPLWFWLLRRDTVMRACLLSAIHWMVFALLIQNWPQVEGSPWLQFVRLNLASGGYAYLPLAAVSLLAIPVGVWVRESFRADRMGAVGRGLALAGVLLAVSGFGLGLATDMSAHAIADGSVKGPARLWYWAVFSGVTLILFAALVAVHLVRRHMHRHTKYIALFGQSALGVFTLHAWVLPLLNWTDRFGATFGALRAAAALAIFVALCALTMTWYARKNRLRLERSPRGAAVATVATTSVRTDRTAASALPVRAAAARFERPSTAAAFA